jgi:hypothetical protein
MCPLRSSCSGELLEEDQLAYIVAMNRWAAPLEALPTSSSVIGHLDDPLKRRQALVLSLYAILNGFLDVVRHNFWT